MRARAFLPVVIGALSLGLAGVSRGAVALDPTTDSPFLPPASAAAAAAVTEGAPIELHGIMATPEGMRFSIFDSAKKSSSWVLLNQRGLPFVVRSYNVVDGSDQVKVDYQGNTITLGLRTAKIATVNMQQAQNLPGQMGGGPMNRGGPTAITQSVALNPTPADEAARLQAVVDAVAARRAARNQAVAQPMNAPAAPVAPADASQQRARQQQQRQQQRAQQK